MCTNYITVTMNEKQLKKAHGLLWGEIAKTGCHKTNAQIITALDKLKNTNRIIFSPILKITSKTTCFACGEKVRRVNKLSERKKAQIDSLDIDSCILCPIKWRNINEPNYCMSHVVKRKTDFEKYIYGSNKDKKYYGKKIYEKRWRSFKECMNILNKRLQPIK